MAVASAGPYANNLHLAPDRQPHQHLSTQCLQAGCSSWRPTNSVNALKNNTVSISCQLTDTQRCYWLTCVTWPVAVMTTRLSRLNMQLPELREYWRLGVRARFTKFLTINVAADSNVYARRQGLLKAWSPTKMWSPKCHFYLKKSGKSVKLSP